MPREKWTDERLDDLNQKVDKGFAETKNAIAETKAEIAETRAEIRVLRGEMKGEIKDLRREMKEGFEGLYRLLFKSAVAMVVALLGVIATLIGVSAF